MKSGSIDYSFYPANQSKPIYRTKNSNHHKKIKIVIYSKLDNFEDNQSVTKMLGEYFSLNFLFSAWLSSFLFLNPFLLRIVKLGTVSMDAEHEQIRTG